MGSGRGDAERTVERMYGREARWYDAIYGGVGRDVAGEVERLAAVAGDHGVAPETLLDVACGTGAHLAEWRERGLDVVGCDLSPDMLAVARERLGDAELIEADMRDFDLGRRFDLVTCLFSAIAHVADEGELDTAIGCMADHVGEGGLLIIEPWLTPDRIEPGGVRDVMTASDDDTAVARLSRSWYEDGYLVIEFGWATASRDGLSFDTETTHLPVFTRQRLLRSVANAGLDPAWDDAEGFGAGRGLLLGRRPA